MLLENFYSMCGDKSKYKTLETKIQPEYENNVPAEIRELWKVVGTGSCMNDFLWVVNPAAFEATLSEVYIPFVKPCIPFARSAFGDLFVWENACVKIINVRFHYSEIIGKNLSVFFNRIATDWDYFSNSVKASNYFDVKKKLGPVSETECYGYIPLLSAGGADILENIKVVKMKEHLSLIAQFAGPIDL